MKTKIFTLLLAVAAGIGTMFASDTQVDGIWYDFNTNDQTASVTFLGRYFNSYSNEYTGAIVIPSSVTYNSVTYIVTSIGESAFSRCSGLTSVTIPNSVTSIGEGAFFGCSGLTSVTIPNSVTSIGGSAFYGCSGLTSVTIPNSVTSIGEGAFSNVNNIIYSGTATGSPWGAKSVNGYVDGLFVYSDATKTTLLGCAATGDIIIPNTVTSIGGSAFYGCSGLTSVTIPNSVTSIGESAFFGCSGLTSPVYNAHVFAYMPKSYSGAYTIPDGIESIAGSAFSGCSGLTSVTIPNSVTSIGNYAFDGCSGLSSVTIPNSVTSIGKNAFYWCSSLTSMTIPNSVTSIGNEAFYGCSGLTSPVYNAHVFAYMPKSYSGAYTIPDGIESIAGSAFSYCSSLTSIEIPNSVTSIGTAAFLFCTGLTSVTIPNSVTSIGGFAFTWCSSLTSLIIEAETPPTIEAYSFYDVDDSGYPSNPLNISIYVPCGTIDTYKTAEVWSDYASLIKYAQLPYKVSTVAENGHVTTTDVTTLTICDPFVTCTAVPDYGYHFTQWSDGLKDNPRIVQITQDTTFTAEFAYDRAGTCGKDLALVWSYDPANKVLTIGNAGEFTENMQFGVEAPTEMEELVIGNNVTAIGEYAFAGISTLKKVTIGESVKTIQNNAFYNCVNLETIFNYRPTPTNAYSTAFDGVDKFECILYVLPNSIDMYKNASVWRDFYYTYAIGAEEATVTTNDVTVEPQDNAATLTWPTSNEAFSYTIEITKDGVVFCRLTFNANGQLTGIAFAPGRDGQSMAPAALMTANGLQFTVTGLNSGTQYGYSLTAKDANEQPIATYSGSFTTTSEGVPTGIDNTPFLSGEGRGEASKLLRNGEVLILRDGKTYTIQGVEVK